MSAQDIYDFETIFPDAAKAVFIQSGLQAFSLSDVADFQQIRPRVEIVFKTLGEAQPKRLAILPDGSKRTSCFRGELRIRAISDTDAPGKAAHSSYRAAVRSVIGGLEAALNGNALTRHKINFTVAGAEETGVNTANGWQETRFPFTVDVSIQQDAWQLLT